MLYSLANQTINAEARWRCQFLCPSLRSPSAVRCGPLTSAEAPRIGICHSPLFAISSDFSKARKKKPKKERKKGKEKRRKEKKRKEKKRSSPSGWRLSPGSSKDAPSLLPSASPVNQSPSLFVAASRFSGDHWTSRTPSGSLIKTVACSSETLVCGAENYCSGCIWDSRGPR